MDTITNAEASASPTTKLSLVYEAQAEQQTVITAKRLDLIQALDDNLRAPLLAQMLLRQHSELFYSGRGHRAISSCSLWFSASAKLRTAWL